MRSPVVGLTNSQSIVLVVGVVRAYRYSAGAAVVLPTRRVLCTSTSAAFVSLINFGSQCAQACATWQFEMVCVPAKWVYGTFPTVCWGFYGTGNCYTVQLPLLLTSLRGLTGFWGFRYFWIPQQQQQHKRLVHCALFQGEADHNLGLHRLLCKTTTKTWNCKRQTNGSVIDSTTHTSPHTHTERKRKRDGDSTCYCLCAQEPIIHFCFVIIRAPRHPMPWTTLLCLLFLPPSLFLLLCCLYSHSSS